MEIEASESLRRVNFVARRIELTTQPSITPEQQSELDAITKEIIRSVIVSKYEPVTLSRKLGI